MTSTKDSSYIWFTEAILLLMMAAGFANIFIIDRTIFKAKDPKRKLWIGLGHSKLVVTLIFFTRILNLMFEAKVCVWIRFALTIQLTFWGTFMKSTREYSVSL